MKELLDTIFPTLSDELIIVISLIIGLLITASLILFLVKKIFPKTNISELSAIKRDKGIKEQYSRSWRSIRPDRLSVLHRSRLFSFSLLHCILNGKEIHASCYHADYI